MPDGLTEREERGLVVLVWQASPLQPGLCTQFLQLRLEMPPPRSTWQGKPVRGCVCSDGGSLASAAGWSL